MLNNIPNEMKFYKQWLVWKYIFHDDQGELLAKPTKIPFNARTGSKASVTDPTTWSTFNKAAEVAHNYSGIGFVLTNDDPYCFIDLDDTKGDASALQDQVDIFTAFDSFSERSPGGSGLHIIIKGSLPIGRRRNFVEIYSNERYMTMTGDVFNDKPIKEHQELLNELFQSMGGNKNNTVVYEGSDVEIISDKELIERALKASNGDKFDLLLRGEWQSMFQSQSEADIAFVNIIAFYTDSKVQVQRIWATSELAKRLKGQRLDYQKYMIDKSFDNKLPPVNINFLKQQIECNEVEETEDLEKLTISDLEIPKYETQFEMKKPPGLIGEIAEFIFASSPRPCLLYTSDAADE